MSVLVLALLALSLAAYVVHLNHVRQPQLGSRLVGSTDVVDRDAVRINAELRAASTRY